MEGTSERKAGGRNVKKNLPRRCSLVHEPHGIAENLSHNDKGRLS